MSEVPRNQFYHGESLRLLVLRQHPPMSEPLADQAVVFEKGSLRLPGAEIVPPAADVAASQVTSLEVAIRGDFSSSQSRHDNLRKTIRIVFPWFFSPHYRPPVGIATLDSARD
jgi:hypothetical protein